MSRLLAWLSLMTNSKKTPCPLPLKISATLLEFLAQHVQTSNKYTNNYIY